MVEPLTVFALATGAKAIGSLVSGEANAAQAEWNEAQAKYNAWYAKQKALVEEARVRRGVKRTVGTARTAAAASGFALESESTQLAIDDIERSGEIDAMMIRHQGDIGEWKGLAQATAFESQAEAAKTAGYFDAFISGVEALTLFSAATPGKKTIGGGGASVVPQRGPFDRGPAGFVTGP